MKMLSDLFKNMDYVKVLDYLLDNPTQIVTRKEVVDSTNVSLVTVVRIFNFLGEIGVVLQTKDTTACVLNLDSSLVTNLLKLDSDISFAMVIEKKLELIYNKAKLKIERKVK